MRSAVVPLATKSVLDESVKLAPSVVPRVVIVGEPTTDPVDVVAFVPVESIHPLRVASSSCKSPGEYLAASADVRDTGNASAVFIA